MIKEEAELVKPPREYEVSGGIPAGMVRPEVAAFALLMEQQLQANDHKPGWKDDAPEALTKRVEQEARELDDAVRAMRRIVWVPHDGRRTGGWLRNNPKTLLPEMGDGYDDVSEPERTELSQIVGSEAADVANFAMMIADVAGALDYSPKAPAASHDAARERIARIIALFETPDAPKSATDPWDWFYWLPKSRARFYALADAILATPPTTDATHPFPPAPAELEQMGKRLAGETIAAIERMREAAGNSLMYLETGFIECERCGNEIETKNMDAVYELRRALAPSNNEVSGDK